MSKELSVDKFRLKLVDWAAQAARPDLGGGVAAPLGSVLFQPSGGQAHMFLKTAAPNAKGWSRQNLVNLTVYNVRAFGAVGDNVTNDAPAIQAAADAANAAGGGIVYFPPGKYAIYRSADIHILQSIDLSGHKNITFLGDGYQSQIRMTGDGQAADWYGFNIYNNAFNITFTGLYFDASQSTNGDPAQQQHTIQVAGTTADLGQPGGHYVTVTGCYFDYQLGDHIRLISNFVNNAENVYGVLVLSNIFLAQSVGQTGTAKFRSAIGFQRNVVSTQSAYNYMDGSSDNTIDYEPTGNGVNQGDCHFGNQANGRSHPAQIFTSSGTSFSTPCQDIAWAHNIGFNGGGISCGDSSTNTWIGNVIVATNTTSSNPMCGVDRVNIEQSFIANVFVSLAPDAAARNMVTFTGDAFGHPTNCMFDGNVIHADGDSLAFNLESPSNISLDGNLVTHRNTDPINGSSVQLSSNLFLVDLIRVRNNLIVPDQTASMRATIKVAPTVQNMASVHIVGNYSRNALAITAGSLFSTPTNAALYIGLYSSIDNLFIGGTNSTVASNASLPNLASGGNAGLGDQIGLCETAAGPETILAAAAGSLATNIAGAGDSAIVFYKETGGPATKTGWLRVGTTDVQFGCADTTTATAARFMATSSDLAAATTVEIQFRVWRACKIRNLRVKQTPGVGAGNISYTLRKNGGNTGVAATFAFSSAQGNSGGASTTFAAGDLVSISITKTAIPGTSPKNAVVTIEIA
jgi:hypothetical protein